MSDNRSLLEMMQKLGLSTEEAVIYLELIKGASTHLRLSRKTGLTRSRVYRLVDTLKRRGLVAHHADDTGRFIVATSPANLELGLVAEEERIKERFQVIEELVPALSRMQSSLDTSTFTVRTYEGADGFRQMLWHELQAQDEILMLGGATIEELASNPRWTERHRAATLGAGYKIRELLNEVRWQQPFTKHRGFDAIYSCRQLDANLLTLSSQICIYNDVVSTYHWRHGKKVGTELISHDYAIMMRQIFEHYWQLGTSLK